MLHVDDITFPFAIARPASRRLFGTKRELITSRVTTMSGDFSCRWLVLTITYKEVNPTRAENAQSIRECGERHCSVTEFTKHPFTFAATKWKDPGIYAALIACISV